MSEDRLAVKFYNEIRLKGSAGIRALAELAADRNDNAMRDGVTRPRAEILREMAESLESNEFIIAVVGEFSRGKSSMLNVLLGREGLLPTSIEPSTATITIVQYSETESARVTYSDGTLSESIPLQGLPKFVVGTDLDGKKASRSAARRLSQLKTQEDMEVLSLPDIGKEFALQVQGSTPKTVKYVDVYIPSEYLKDGLKLVDTPGIGSVNPEHGQATREFINRADAVIFLINTDPVISDSECNFLMFLQDYIQQFVFAVTKIDRFSEDERALSVRYTRDTIKEYAGIPDPPIYPMSARWALEGVAEGDDEKTQKSGFPEFRRGLEHYLISERGRLVLQSASRQVRLQLNEMKASIESETKHLFMNTDEFQARLEAMNKGLREASYVRGAICRDLDKALQGTEDMIYGQVDWLRAKATLRREVEDEIDAYGWGELQKANELLPLLVKDRLDAVLGDVFTIVSEQISAVRNDSVDYAMETLAKLGQEAGYRVEQPEEHAEWDITFKTSSDAFRRNLKKVGTMTIGSTLALTVAGVFLFGGIGAIAMVGGLLMGGGATPFVLKKTRDQLRKEVLGPLDDMMDQLLDDMKTEIVRDLEDFRGNITNLLDGAISNVSSTVARMDVERREVDFDSNQRNEDLAQQLARLEEISDDLNQLRFFAGYIAGSDIDELKTDAAREVSLRAQQSAVAKGERCEE